MSMPSRMSRKSYGVQAYAQHATDASGDVENRNEVFEVFRPRILAIARRIADRIPPGSSLTVEDLASYGAIGLLEVLIGLIQAGTFNYDFCRLSDPRCDDRCLAFVR